MKKVQLLAVFCLMCTYTQVGFGGLAYHYTLNGNANDVVSGWNGTAYNTSSTSDRYGQAGQALYFNGCSAYVEMPDLRSVLNYDTDWSLNIWACATAGVEEGVLFGGGDGGSGYKQFYFTSASSRVTMSADSLADYHIVDTSRYDPDPSGDGFWHMYTLTWDNEGILSFYVDGELFGSDSIGSLSDFYPDTWIPVLGAGSTGYSKTITNFFNGAIDDFSVYDHTLTQAEISGLAATVPVPSALLLCSLGLGMSSWRRRRA